MNLDQPLLLASQSPRRKQLLQEAGFTHFRVRATDADETIPPNLPIEHVAGFLAEKKAGAALEWLAGDEIIIAADTIVVFEGKIYGKPSSNGDAFGMIRRLSGAMHEVITGVCLQSRTKKMVFSDTAQVYFDDFTNEEIYYYIDRYQPFDKAGAYGIQEWIGLCKIQKIIGSYSTIMGLPMQKVYPALENW